MLQNLTPSVSLSRCLKVPIDKESGIYSKLFLELYCHFEYQIAYGFFLTSAEVVFIHVLHLLYEGTRFIIHKSFRVFRVLFFR